MSIEKIEEKVKEEMHTALESIKGIEKAAKRETHETYVAAEILLKLSKGEEVSKEQMLFLKEQSVDFAKSLSLIGLMALPGSSLAVIGLEKLGKKYGFNIFPQDESNLGVE